MRRIAFCLLLLLSLSAPVWAQDEPAGECEPLAPLVVGEFGRVSAGDANSVRSAPTTSGERIGAIPGGETFAVLDGPRCADGFVWWQVEYQGLTGWTVDGADGEQWLFPVDATETIDVQVDTPVPLFTTVITPENTGQLTPVWDVLCDSGPAFTPYFALSNNQRYLAFDCNTQPGSTAVYDLLEHRQIAALVAESGNAYGSYFLPGDQQLITIYRVSYASSAANPWLFTVWDIPAEQVTASFSYTDGLKATYDTAHNELVLLESNQIRRLDARTLEETSSTPLVETNEGDFAAMALSPDGTTIAAISNADAGIISLWDTTSGTLLPQIETPFMTNILSTVLTFSPSGRYIIAAGCKTRTGDGFFCGSPEILWGEVASGSIVERWAVPTSSEGNNSISITSLAFSPDGKLLAAGAGSNVLIYAVQSGALVFNTANRAHEVMFSHDGTFLVTTGDGVYTRVWRIPE
jgi:WD40 repeat protein